MMARFFDTKHYSWAIANGRAWGERMLDFLMKLFFMTLIEFGHANSEILMNEIIHENFRILLAQFFTQKKMMFSFFTQTLSLSLPSSQHIKFSSLIAEKWMDALARTLSVNSSRISYALVRNQQILCANDSWRHQSFTSKLMQILFYGSNLQRHDTTRFTPSPYFSVLSPCSQGKNLIVFQIHPRAIVRSLRQKRKTNAVLSHFSPRPLLSPISSSSNSSLSSISLTDEEETPTPLQKTYYCPAPETETREESNSQPQRTESANETRSHWKRRLKKRVLYGEGDVQVEQIDGVSVSFSTANDFDVRTIMTGSQRPGDATEISSVVSSCIKKPSRFSRTPSIVNTLTTIRSHLLERPGEKRDGIKSIFDALHSKKLTKLVKLESTENLMLLCLPPPVPSFDVHQMIQTLHEELFDDSLRDFWAGLLMQEEERKAEERREDKRGQERREEGRGEETEEVRSVLMDIANEEILMSYKNLDEVIFDEKKKFIETSNLFCDLNLSKSHFLLDFIANVSATVRSIAHQNIADLNQSPSLLKFAYPHKIFLSSFDIVSSPYLPLPSLSSPSLSYSKVQCHLLYLQGSWNLLWTLF